MQKPPQILIAELVILRIMAALLILTIRIDAEQVDPNRFAFIDIWVLQNDIDAPPQGLFGARVYILAVYQYLSCTVLSKALE